MKLKRWHLYIVISLCFVMIFISMNKKYDRFYRVNGINNDNRALIEIYLDQDEQNYLIEKGIAVNKFIEYIEVKDFYLPNYEYYNAIKKAKIFSDPNTLVQQTNVVVSRLEKTYNQNTFKYFNQLISNNLVLAFINNDEFNFTNIDYYQQVRSLYGNDDYTYITDTNSYILVLTNQIKKNDNELLDIIKIASDNYDKNSLNILFMTPLDSTINRIFNPQDLSTIVNRNNFIGSYEPKNRVPINEISRVSYSMYLEKNAYEALLLMFKDIQNNCGDDIVLTKAYRSYELLLLSSIEGEDVPGYNEYQLGTTIDLQKTGYSVADFINTDCYNWLIENSYKYGYILRYPQGKETVTNHEFKSNVFRYVGVDLAQLLYENNMTLEEYQIYKEQ